MAARQATPMVPGLDDAVTSQIYEHIFVNADHEVGGVLVGTLGDKALPTVTGAISALEARGERASVTFTHEAWATVHATLERDFPGQQIVGWYHSHPGFGIFLSRHDLFIHENFFSDPRQVAYVVDPQAGTEGVFIWRDGSVIKLVERRTSRPGTGSRRREMTLPPVAPAPPLAPVAPPVAHMAPAENVTIRSATPRPAPAPSPTPAFERPLQYAQSTSLASDPRFVRRAALVAAALGAVCGAATQLLVG
jgi:proteasome lid subunit RPN8/RPN11